MRAKLPVGALVGAVMAIACGSAGATTYCVPAHAGCTGTTEATLTAAINAANVDPNSDDIVLAAGTFAGGPSVNYEAHIRGAGQGLTFIDGNSSGYGVYLGHPNSTISDLTIHEPAGGPTIGLYLAGAAERVTVDLRDNPVNSSTAVSLHDEGSFADGSALNSVTTSGADYGIQAVSTGPMLVSGVEAQGRYAMTTSGPGPVTIRFARITGNIDGVYAEAADTLIDDSTVTGAPILANLSSGGDILATVRHVTLNHTHAGVESDVSGQTAHMVVSNSAVVGGDPDPETSDLYDRAFPGATGILEVDYSYFRSDHVAIAGGGTKTYTPGAHNITDGSDPKLLDLAHGDLRLRFDSPLIDAGDPVPGGGEPMADLVGEFRAVNGRTDIGAYEYGRHAPTVAADLDPKSALVGDTVRFNAIPADPDPTEAPVVTWAFDDGGTASGVIVTHVFTTPGTHTATATATDPAGLTGTTTVSLPVVALPVPPKAMAPSFGFTKLKARKGFVGIPLTCPLAATDCTGTVELQLAPKPKAKKGTASKTVILGRARYAIAHGQHKTVKVKLTKSARKRLRKASHGLRVKVVVKPKGAKSKSKTVRLAAR